MERETTYREENDCQNQSLIPPDDGASEDIFIGKWGQLRLNYLKKHKRALYATLRLSGNLRAHLLEINETAHEQREIIVRQMMAERGVTERLKAENQTLWLGRINNIRACADEIIRSDLIYD